MNERLIYMTAPTEEVAESLSRALLDAHLIACANIIPGVRSLYQWKGRIQDDSEVVIIAKTTDHREDEVIAQVKKLHPYECPCVVSVKLEAGNSDFLSWINSGCR